MGSLLWRAGFLAVACRIFSCGMWTFCCGLWELVPPPGIKPEPPALGTRSLSHWTTREIQFLKCPLNIWKDVWSCCKKKSSRSYDFSIRRTKNKFKHENNPVHCGRLIWVYLYGKWFALSIKTINAHTFGPNNSVFRNVFSSGTCYICVKWSTQKVVHCSLVSYRERIFLKKEN